MGLETYLEMEAGYQFARGDDNKVYVRSGSTGYPDFESEGIVTDIHVPFRAFRYEANAGRNLPDLKWENYIPQV